MAAITVTLRFYVWLTWPLTDQVTILTPGNTAPPFLSRLDLFAYDVLVGIILIISTGQKVIVCNLVVSLVAHCRWVQASHANSPPWRIFQNPIIGRIPYWAWRTRTFKSRRRHYWLFLKHRRACLPGYGWGNWYVLKSLYLIQFWTSYRLVFWVHHKHYTPCFLVHTNFLRVKIVWEKSYLAPSVEIPISLFQWSNSRSSESVVPIDRSLKSK